jgi:protein ImuB
MITHALKRAGLKTIGEVAARSRHELAARFGGAFVMLLWRTLGKQGGPISPRTPVPDLMAERRFADPVTTEEAIAETLFSLSQTLASVLENRGQGARMLQASFFRADGQMRRLSIETGQATRDPMIFKRLFREKLAALADPLDPGFGFDLIQLSAHCALELTAKNVGLDENAVEGEVAFLVDRLAARFGAHRVMRFEMQDTHIPEAETIAVPAQYKEKSGCPWPPGGNAAPRRPLRLFAKAEPIEVVSEVPDGPPLKFRWRQALHNVAQAEGPERIAMEWWRHPELKPTRDYFRVEDEAGRRFWLYRDGIYARELAHPRWYVHGLFA